MWNDVLKHFALPEGVYPNLVKGWTLVKMTTQFQNFKKKLTKDFIKNNRTPNWDEYPKIKDHWKSFVEYKKSETFAQKSAQVKSSASKKGEYNHRLGRGSYAIAIPKWRKMEQDLITKGILSSVFHWPERSKNWYYAHGGRLNPDDGTFEFLPTLREKALELMNKIEDVKAGRLKVDREMDELTMAFRNPEHLGCCRGYGVVPWKYAFKGNLDSYRSHKRRKEREDDHWSQMMEKRLKEQDENMQVDIERRLVVTISKIAQTGAALPEVPLDPVISPSARKSSCASTEVALGACIEVAPGACTEGPEEPRAIEGVPVDDN
jgi:hypothetical protein